MQKILLILFAVILSALLSGCGFFYETVCEVQDRNGVAYLTNQEEPFTSKKLCKDGNGQIVKDKDSIASVSKNGSKGHG